MHERYVNKEIARIFADEHKLCLWQNTELAVIQAREELALIPQGTYEQTAGTLNLMPIDLEYWKAKDREMNHDLNAFIDERRRFLPKELAIYFHQGMTSYDTEEPAFAIMLKETLEIVTTGINNFDQTLHDLALKYRYTPMLERTHGQEAKIMSFGKRILSYIEDFECAAVAIDQAEENLEFSKLSGAIGNYGNITPEIEKRALAILGLKPFYGATQIMPRGLYVPLASGLCQMVMTLNKIALDIRLGARSGRPIVQEPFGKKQRGSSAMPHKKNTITTEQMEGMARMALGYLSMIMQNIVTWEGRSIEQSCVERVAWPDLFQVVMNCLTKMDKVLNGLTVYPDNMMLEIVDSCGCYASDEAKELLKEFGVDSDDAYRIIQLAAFNAFEVKRDKLPIPSPTALDEVDQKFNLANASLRHVDSTVSISTIISNGVLTTSAELAATIEEVNSWNKTLRRIFALRENHKKWEEIFNPSHYLKNEEILYEKIL